MTSVPATTHTVYFEPASGIDRLPDALVQLVVTSPPYPMIEMWDGIFAAQDPEIGNALHQNQPEVAFEGMHRILDSVWRELYRVVFPGGIVCINIGDATRTVDDCFRLYANHARIIESCARLGFQNLPNIIWRKPTNAPNKFMGSGMLPPGAYVTLEHEYILIFRKGGKREFRTTEEKQRRAESAYFWEERNQWFSDVWFDLKGTDQKLSNSETRNRSAAFPFELAWRLINMFSIKGDTVLDPFVGTGTTILAAATAERNSLGFEIDREMRNLIDSQLRSAPQLSETILSARLNRHLSFIKEREANGQPLAHRLSQYSFPCVSRQEIGMVFHLVDAVIPSADNSYRVTYRTPADLLNYQLLASALHRP